MTFEEYNNEWNDFVQRIIDHVSSCTPEKLEQLRKDVSVEEYTTPFGTLCMTRPALLRRTVDKQAIRDYYATLADGVKIRKLKRNFIPDNMED